MYPRLGTSGLEAHTIGLIQADFSSILQFFKREKSFRLGNPTLGKIHSSTHSPYMKNLTLHTISLYIAEIRRKFLYIRQAY